ncbi:lysophospholipid acyltransferase family protein [Desulfovibrio ferrophilus]|uniref:Phospholipid/glycerol acyltransferase n=1 Tax=Desulfovibrio ferrophilus TaxID=241368 RepID=A0A2Z6B1T9_9BACT|nr:GNAT family N-acyltransferase [Desulfovibrio ferrophilus]BBD09487.1 phospholipid/glycerol acyltransferase [Desulfovibrio ferrophilus]
MPQAHVLESPFDLNLPLNRPLRAMVQPPLEKLLCLPTLKSLYSEISGRKNSDFLADVLNLLSIQVDVPETDLSNIPATGPAVVVANHPFGAIEGVILLQTLRRVRPDVKVMANHVLSMIPEMREHLISVDPFGSRKSSKRNIGPLKEAIRWARGGGLLAVFPAGEVSSLQLRKRTVTDPQWSPSIGRIIRITKAPVVPVHFDGHNGPLFHLLGMIHPRLRTMMLPREMLNKQRRTVCLDVGRMIPAQKIQHFENDEKLTDYLRLRTYLLKHKREQATGLTPPTNLEGTQPVAQSCGPALLAAEIESQPAQNVLLEQGDQMIICAQGRALPAVLPEIGRLRELNFRDVGEGTGLARDLDRFDDDYHHLVLWHKKDRRIVGAYRVGCVDSIVDSSGIKGLYTSTLFKYDHKFLDALGPCLEMGRAFISKEYRKSYNPLLLLWKGIARFVYRHKRYKTIFGPVSISNDYNPLSRHLMMHFLKGHQEGTKALLKTVRPLTPPKIKARVPGGFKPGSIAAICPDIEDLGTAVADIESDGKGVPVLLRQYLKLGGQVLTFNLDRDFGDAIDGLIVVDLTKTSEKTLARYMGKDEVSVFRAYHLRMATHAA